MGNYAYSTSLIGLTINEANQYIIDNYVYMNHFDVDHITKVKVIYHSSFAFINYSSTELNVYLDNNNKICKLAHLG